jgi:translation elongation factor EF-G
VPGDILAVSRVDDIHFDAVLHDSHDEDHFHLSSLECPVPLFGLAIHPTKRGDEQKLTDALHKLESEDPCFHVEHNAAANETVMRGLGELHLRVLCVDSRSSTTSTSRPIRRASPTARPSRPRPRDIIATRSRPAAPDSSARSI